MFPTLRRRTLIMAFETSRPFIASTRSNGFHFRTINHLATNGMRQRTYEETIDALNSLQSNSSKIKDSISKMHNNDNPNVKSTEIFLQKVGIKLDDLDKLSVIHVAGTKGKGSTCALVESVLRNLNVKTGFFSSPHLLSVTERIQINGEPISEDTFVQYFWNIYNRLDALKNDAFDMPPYFKFLTVLAYHIFLNEKIDVAIIEVGIGGEYDCTNVLRNTRTVGITSLGLDHTQLLGNTYRDIAWQKSGIIKPGSSVFSTQQHNECIPVLLERSKEKNATINFVPKFSEYQYNDEKALAEIALNPTKLRNSSLAIQLCYDWIRSNEDKIENKSVCEHLKGADGGMTLKKEIVEGLANCQWPGRCQTVSYENLRIHIDGAHTMESLQLCIDWFNESTQFSTNKKVLIFNITGPRDVNEMLNLINQKVKFTEAIFTQNILSISAQATDNKLTVMPPNRSKEFSKHWIGLSSDNKAQAFDCVSDVFDYLHVKYQNDQVTVLVTGSLHLVAEVLRMIKN